MYSLDTACIHHPSDPGVHQQHTSHQNLVEDHNKKCILIGMCAENLTMQYSGLLVKELSTRKAVVLAWISHNSGLWSKGRPQREVDQSLCHHRHEGFLCHHQLPGQHLRHRWDPAPSLGHSFQRGLTMKSGGCHMVCVGQKTNWS